MEQFNQTLIVTGYARNSQERPHAIMTIRLGTVSEQANDTELADAVKTLVYRTGFEIVAAVIRAERSIL